LQIPIRNYLRASFTHTDESISVEIINTSNYYQDNVNIATVNVKPAMPIYSREYARSKDLNKWDIDIEDEFLALRYNNKKAHQKARTKIMYCDGLGISKIRFIYPSTQEVFIHGEWISFEKMKQDLYQ